jgi:hypothetical protein
MHVLILIAKKLNILKPKEVLETKIRACIGEKNVLNIFLKANDKDKLTSVCNVQCLNAAVYKFFLKES